MKRMWLVVGVLASLHLLVLFAGFVAPYDPAQQMRALPYAPPSRLHFRNADGRFQLTPIVYDELHRGAGRRDAVLRRFECRGVRRGRGCVAGDVMRDWRTAKAWLYRELSSGSGDE